MEMAYRWGDIEGALPTWVRPSKSEGAEDQPLGRELSTALIEAFRVEANVESGDDAFGGEWHRYWYEILFDVEEHAGREAADTVRNNLRFLENVVKKLSGGEDRGIQVRVVSAGTPATGQVCAHLFDDVPKKHVDVTDVPEEKPESNVPLTTCPGNSRRSGVWFCPL